MMKVPPPLYDWVTVCPWLMIYAGTAVTVSQCSGRAVAVGVPEGVGVPIGVGVDVLVRLDVGMAVRVGVLVAVGVLVGGGVGPAQLFSVPGM